MSVYLSPPVYSQEFDYELGGVIYDQPSYFRANDDSLLSPDNDIQELHEFGHRFYAKINFDISYEKTKFISQFRPTAMRELDFITDDAYLDLDIGGGYFLFIGKKNIRDGVAYGANPTDFLGEDKEVDSTKREEEKRIERRGNYLVGGEAFFENISFSALYAPKLKNWQKEKDRVLLKGNLFAESINTDMALSLFNGSIPGIGFNISSTISDNFVLNAESAARWGSEKKTITVVSEGSSIELRTFQITDPDDDEKVYPHLAAGGSYTFEGGTNLVLEYIFNGAGYNSSEWDEIVGFIKYNHDAYRNDFFKYPASENLDEAGEIVEIGEMRKHYVFFRLSNSTLIENLDKQLVFKLNADDMSFLTFLSLDYNMAANKVIGISSTIFSGEDDSEMGMMYLSSQVNLIFKYYF